MFAVVVWCASLLDVCIIQLRSFNLIKSFPLHFRWYGIGTSCVPAIAFRILKVDSFSNWKLLLLFNLTPGATNLSYVNVFAGGSFVLPHVERVSIPRFSTGELKCIRQRQKKLWDCWQGLRLMWMKLRTLRDFQFVKLARSVITLLTSQFSPHIDSL